MKLLVTGSTGLVGSEAVRLFTERGWDVVGVDANMRSAFFGTPAKTPALQLDIRDTFRVKELFEENKFDAVIHAAAQPSHDYSKEHVLEDFHVNAMGTLNLLEAARHNTPEAVFVHVSTDKIYGAAMRTTLYEEEKRYVPLHWNPDAGFQENTAFVAPFSPFGVSKLAADFYAQEYAAQGWLTTGIFRPGCITGRNHEGAEQHGFLAYLAKCIKEGTTYKIYGYKGKQVRDQIHAYDLVSAFAQFIAAPRSGAVYNIGGGQERSVSVLEAGDLIAKETGKEFKYELIDEPRFGDRQWDVHDVTKFQKDYPEWIYEYDLEAIIKDICTK